MMVIGRRSAESSGWRAKRRKRPVRGKLRYRFQEPSAVAKRDAEFLEVAFGEISEHVKVDLVLAKPFLVLTKTEAAEPPADIHDRRSRRGARNYPRSSLANAETTSDTRA